MKRRYFKMRLSHYTKPPQLISSAEAVQPSDFFNPLRQQSLPVVTLPYTGDEA